MWGLAAPRIDGQPAPTSSSSGLRQKCPGTGTPQTATVEIDKSGNIVLRPCAGGTVSGITAATSVTAGSSLPVTCTTGQLFYRNTGATGLYVCTSPNVWTQGNTVNGLTPQQLLFGSSSGAVQQASAVTFDPANNRLTTTASAAGGQANTVTTDANGQKIVSTNGNAGNNTGARTSLLVDSSTDGRQTDSGFSNEAGVNVIHRISNGQYTSAAKRTTFGLSVDTYNYGATQGFTIGGTSRRYSMGDATFFSGLHSYAGGIARAGDEGTSGLSLSVAEDTTRRTDTIAALPAASTCATTLAAAVTGSRVAQGVTVNSAANCVAGDWLVVGAGRAWMDDDNNIEAVKIISVSGNVINAVFANNHSANETVKGATLVQTTNGAVSGQFMHVVNLSASAYSAGTATATNGNTTITGNGTAWTANMVGGAAPNFGCLSLAGDTETSGAFSNVSPRAVWLPITGVNSATSLEIAVRLQNGVGGYAGYTSGSASNYVIRPCARVLTTTAAAGSGVPSNTLVLDVPAGTFSWSVGQTLEQPVSPNQDVQGLRLTMYPYLRSGVRRYGVAAVNAGQRTIEAGFTAVSGLPFAAGSERAFSHGFYANADAANAFTVAGTVSNAAVNLTAGSGAGTRLLWGTTGQALEYNTANQGLELSPSEGGIGASGCSGAANHCFGRLYFQRSTVAGSNNTQLLWVGNTLLSGSTYGTEYPRLSFRRTETDPAVTFNFANQASAVGAQTVIWPSSAVAATTYTLGLHIVLTPTIDLPATAAASVSVHTITDARTHGYDACVVNDFSGVVLPLAGILQCRLPGNGSIEIYLTNPTGASINPASGTFSVHLLKN